MRRRKVEARAATIGIRMESDGSIEYTLARERVWRPLEVEQAVTLPSGEVLCLYHDYGATYRYAICSPTGRRPPWYRGGRPKGTLIVPNPHSVLWVNSRETVMISPRLAPVPAGQQ